MTATLIAYGIAVLVTAIAAVTDFRKGEIPNWLTLPPLVIAPIVFGAIDGSEGLFRSGLGILVCGAVPLLLFRMGGMAGGDVKLFAAIGAITGAFVGLQAELLAFLFAALFALGRLAWQGKLLSTLGNTLFLGLNPVLPKKHRREVQPELMSKIRLGIPILAGTLASVLLSWGGLSL